MSECEGTVGMKKMMVSGKAALLLSQLVPPCLRDAWATAHDLFGELPMSYAHACEHEVGDTLADFLVIELFESGAGENLASENEAVAAMLTTVDKTIDELSKFQSMLVQLQKR